MAEEEQEDWRRGERVVVVMGLILGVKMRDFDGGKQGGTGERERREGFGGGRRREEKEGIFLVFRKRQLSLSCLEKQWSLSLNFEVLARVLKDSCGSFVRHVLYTLFLHTVARTQHGAHCPSPLPTFSCLGPSYIIAVGASYVKPLTHCKRLALSCWVIPE